MSRLPIRARVGNRSLQQTNEPSDQRLDAGAIEQVGPVFQPQPQPLPRHRHQAQRIMRRVVARDVGQPQPAGRLRKARPLGRVVLEHRQGVEQLPHPSQCLDLRQAHMLVRHQPRLALLHLAQQRDERLAGRAAAAAAAC